MFQNKIFKLPSIVDRVDLSQLVTAKVDEIGHDRDDVIALKFKCGATIHTSKYINKIQAGQDLEQLYLALERYHEPYNTILEIPNTSDSIDISTVANVSQWGNSDTGEKWLRIYLNVPNTYIETFKSKDKGEVKANLRLVREKMAEYSRYLNNR